ncbi:MAG TPA: phosphoribosylglycinamide formyltransferase [Candidatus Limnocylindria bacterium]
MTRLGVLVSGRGSNLEAILDAGLEVAAVISNRPAVRALEVAAAHGVPVHVLRRSAYPDAGARDAAIGTALAGAGVELAVLAGYDQLLRPPYFAAFGGRTVNIHPSLLPAHGGAGMMGLAVHASVLAAGEPETGVTIHEVIPELDAGPILAQARVPVTAGDTPETLAARVLVVEHRLLVDTLRALVAVPSAASNG